MRNLILIVCLFSVILGYSQKNDKFYVEELVESFTSELENRGISRYFYTQRWCEGENQIFVMPDGSNCFTNGDYYATYVVWMEDAVSKIRKIDNCGMYETLDMNNNRPYNFFDMFFNSLIKNPVRTYDILKKEGGPVPNTDIYNCHRKYKFTNGEIDFAEEYRLFDLTNVALEKNLNYEYNSKLKVVDLDLLMDVAIDHLEKSKSLRRL